MPRFFIGRDQVRDGSIDVLGADAAHLSRALRVRPGELVVVVEEGHTEHGVRVDEVTPNRVAGRIAWSRPATGEPGLDIAVLQALPARGMDLAVEALAEAGATTIVPVLTRRGVARPGAARATGRAVRWQQVAREAAQLAGRARAPEVRALQALPDAVAALAGGPRLLACVVGGTGAAIAHVSVVPRRAVALVIGPEGGFDDSERALLRDAGAEEVHLGSRVLPAWLAGAIAVSLLLAGAGDLDAGVATGPPA